MTDYLLIVVVGIATGIGSTIGSILVKLWLEPYLQKIHEKSQKLKDVPKIFDKIEYK